MAAVAAAAPNAGMPPPPPPNVSEVGEAPKPPKDVVGAA